MAVTATPAVDQVEQRQRRRTHRLLTYGGEFDLLREVADVTTPLAARVAAEPRPAACGAGVDELVAATHAAVVAIGDMLAESDAQRRTAHLPVERRGQAVKLLVELAKAERRPSPPDVDRDLLVSGAWPEILVDHCRPIAGPLSDLLERAAPPGALRGALSVSERLEGALRGIDRAAALLERGLDAAARQRAEQRGSRAAQRPSESDKKRAALAEMGVQL
jgi:hypothetical protein